MNRDRDTMRPRRALIACANHYESAIQVGDHHIARGLVAAGFRVAFIANPISPLHAARAHAPEIRDRFRSFRRGGRRHLEGALWSYVPGALAPPREQPLLRSERFQRGWHRLTLPNLVGRVRREGFGEVDLLYIREPRQAFWLDEIRFGRSVFRLADRDSGFAAHGPSARRLEESVASRVDLLAYTASTLAGHAEALKPKDRLHLPNGVDFAHFAAAPREAPAEYREIPRPIAVYAGSLDHWFDYELLEGGAESLRDVSFVLIGPTGRVPPRLRRQANVHLLGPRPYRRLPAYLRHADVDIIPFDASGQADLVASVNPLKLYEYLACGLPVVAARWEELQRLGSPARLYRGREEFVECLRAALRDPGPPEERIAFARGHDWGQRVRALLQALDLEAVCGGRG
ncbi:MAG: glycosyltransferase [Planctomycetota bacterium]